MSTKIVNSIKYIGVLTLVLSSIIACEKDFENVGVGLVDNNLFTPDVETFEVISYNEDLEKSRVDNVTNRLLGVYNHSDFGLLKSSIISQLNLGEIKFSDNMSIDTIILDIPYFATKQKKNSDGTPNFKLDSIVGKQDVEFNIKVHELGTFLNVLDPVDPSKNKKYYSDDTYTRKALLYSGMFKPNKNDTLLEVKRKFLDGKLNTSGKIDSIKKEKLVPSIKIPLDENFFKNNFLNQQNSGTFDSNDSFKNYFRGLIIDANGTDGAMMKLAMSKATVTIYYSNLTDETTTTKDLNGDGDTDDKDVIANQSTTFLLGGVSTSQYTRDYTTSTTNILQKFNSPNKVSGEDKLYVQGAAGSIAVLELFKGIDLNEIREKNWLINQASLTLYVDNPTDTIIPNKLYLYNYDYNSQILDANTERFIGGKLQKDKDNKPLKYEFIITDYISEVLKNDSEAKDISKLAIKTYNQRDKPVNALDTLMRNYSWDAKGVVLKGNSPLTDTKRLKLEIFYTKNNQ
jgi:hypothetical protein